MAETETRPGDEVVEGAELYLSGLSAKDEDRAAQGLRRVLGGLERGVGASGATLEGSTLRQAQLARATVDCWLAARGAGRPEQWRLAGAARSVIGAYDVLHLSGGLPEIGGRPDAFQDSAPFAHLSGADRAELEALRREGRVHDLEALRRDGWLRLDRGPWSGLWHCPIGGWPAHLGLAHHDLGSAELHWNGLPLLVDPGTPPAERKDLAESYRAATAHGGLSLDRKNPYPENRPGYSDAFRREVAGPAPDLRTTHDGVKLSMDGFGRFGGHRQIERSWHFDGAALRIADMVLGTGRPLIERRLVTPWLANRDEAGVVLSQGGHQLRLSSEGTITLEESKRWNERGDEVPLTCIVIAIRANLPWSGALTLAPIPA